jgi:hypothetical protein
MKNWEGGDRGLIEELPNLSRGTEGSYENPVRITCPGQDSNRAPPEYKRRASPLYTPAQSYVLSGVYINVEPRL